MKQDDIEQLAAIRLNHSSIVSSHPCSEASCEQAFLLRLLAEREATIARLQGAQDALSDLPDCMESADDEPCEGFKALQSEIDELHLQMDDAAALTAAAQAARNAALNEAAQIVRNRACGYMSLPSDAIFNAGLIVEDLSRLEQRIRSLSTKGDKISELPE